MMPIDSDFGALERRKLKSEKNYDSEKYITMIKEASCKQFEVNFVEHDLLEYKKEYKQVNVVKVLNYKDFLCR